MASRTLELILKITTAASADLQRLKKELQELGNFQAAGVTQGFQGISKGAEEAGDRVGGLRGGLDKLGSAIPAIAGIGAAFFGIQTAIQGAISAGSAFYAKTIGANEKLNQQILESQTSIASTSKISKDGVEITDPLAKIKAVEALVTKTTAQIEKDTESLVGVTSEQVQGVGAIVFRNIKDIQGQFDPKKFDLSQAAAGLAKGFTAEAALSKVPLEQLNQEISSIFRGEVTDDSLIAKKLGLTPKSIAGYKAKGTLVDEVLKKLETSVAGNAELASKSIGGAFSNIQDFSERFFRSLGKPIFEPILQGTNAVFGALKKNEALFFGVASGIGQALGGVTQILNGALNAALAGFNNILQAIAPVASVVGNVLSTAFSTVVTVLSPVKALLEAILNSPVGQFVAQVAGVVAVLGAIAVGAAVIIPIVTSIGAAISGVIAGFGIFGGVVGSVTGLFTGFGGIIGTVTSAIAGFGGAAGGISGIFTAISSSVAGAFTAFTALPALLATVGGALGGLPALIGGAFGALPGLLGGAFTVISGFVTGTLPAFAAAAAPIVAVGAAISAGFGVVVAVLSQLPALFAPIVEPAVKLGQTISVIGGAILGGLFSKIPPLADGAGKAFSFLAEIVGKTLGGAFGLVQDIALGIFSGIGDLIGGAIGIVQSAIVGLINNPAFQALAKTLGINLDEVKKGLDDLGKVGSEAAKKTGDSTKKAVDNMQVAGTGAVALGNSYKQLGDKAENALRRLNDASSDGRAVQESAKELTELTNQQVELGQITQAEAEKRLNAIANNAKVEVDAQQKAKDSITKIRESGSKEVISSLDTEIKEVEAAVKTKELSETDGATRIADLKKRKLAEQLQTLNESIAAEQAAIAKGNGSRDKLEELQRNKRGVEADIKVQDTGGAEAIAKAATETKKRELDTQKANLDAHLAQIDAAVANGSITEVEAARKITGIKKEQLDIQLKDIQAQIVAAQASNDPEKVKQLEAQATKVRADIQKSGADGQKAIFTAQLKDFDDKEKKATDTVKLAEAERTAEIDKQVAAGTLTREKAEDQKLKLKQDSLKKEIESERAAIAAIQAIRADNPEAQKQKDQRIIDGKMKIANLVSSLAQNESAQQEKLKEAAKKSADDAKKSQQEASAARAKAIESASQVVQAAYAKEALALQPQVRVYDAITKAIENQSKLLGARQSVLQASNDLAQTFYGVAIEAAEREGDSEKAAKLKLEAKNAEYETLVQTQEYERQSLGFEIQKNLQLLEQEKIKLRIQQIDAASATAKAKADDLKLQSDPEATAGQKAASKQGVAAAQDREVALKEQGVLLERQKVSTEDIGDKQLEALDKKQEGQRYQKAYEISKLEADGGDTSRRDSFERKALDNARGEQGQINSGAFRAPSPTIFVPNASTPGSPTVPGQASPSAATSQNTVIQPAISFNNFFDSSTANAKSKSAANTVEKALVKAMTDVFKQAGVKNKAAK